MQPKFALVGIMQRIRNKDKVVPVFFKLSYMPLRRIGGVEV